MAKVEVVMPQMGESVMEGTVIEWSKSVGDTIEVDETLLEIATDKVDSEVPSPEAGTLIEILVEEGDTIEVGKPIAIIETDADAVEETSEKSEPDHKEEEKDDVPEEKEKPEAEEETSSEETSGSANDGGEQIEVVMPQMGESVVEATVIEWNKNVGDTVEEDETLLEISTDKVDSEVPSPAAGTLVEIRAQADETIEVGQVIAIISTGKSSGVAPQKESSKQSKKEESSKAITKEDIANMKPEELAQNGNKASSISDIPKESSDGRFFSPLVRSIAKEEGISIQELENIEGSGQGGRVSKDDILSYVETRKTGKTSTATASQPKPETKTVAKPSSSDGSIHAGELDVSHSPKGDVEVVKMDRMRKMIAEHMVRSKHTSAHVTTFAEVDVTNMVKWRNANKNTFQQKTGVKLTFTPLFVEAIIKSMLEFPLINSSVDGDNILLKKDINFGLAVALGSGGDGGLIVPVIKKAQQMNLVGLAESVNEVAVKARSKKLSPDDLVGGTITLTNYGSVGNLMGTPIINQPQVAIIGTGAIVKRPVVMETDDGDVIAIRQMMFLSMSYDHRIIDGAHGGAFINRVKEILEDFDMDRAL
ncbi:MAG: 2-oxoglutarate dehydrogenase, E2 component, dihydrolipoamide succinyltransferase [Balneolaceae bacterium]